VEALTAMGLKAHAAAVQKGIDMFPKPYPRDLGARREFMSRVVDDGGHPRGDAQGSAERGHTAEMTRVGDCPPFGFGLANASTSPLRESNNTYYQWLLAVAALRLLWRKAEARDEVFYHCSELDMVAAAKVGSEKQRNGAATAHDAELEIIGL
jgi:hypothetical protein